MKSLSLFLMTIAFSLASMAQTARVQVIHNSPDDAATEVDVYLNGSILIPAFAFRTASPFIDAPAGVEIQIDIAPAGSADVSESIANFPLTLTGGETYVVVADGITGLSPTVFNPAPAFGLEIYAMGREAAATSGNTDVLVHHGSTDAPTVDVVEVGVGAGIIVDNAAYPGFAGYLELPTNDYTLAVQDEENTVTVATYEAPLATLGLTDAAITVVASGFLDPSNNGDGPAFGLYAALATGGPLVALPAPEPAVARVQIIHNSPDDAATSVDVYLNGAILVPGFEFRTATPFIDAPAGVEIQVDIAPAGSADVSESIANFPLTLAEGETYVVVADGITGLSSTEYNPAPAFGLEIYALGREAAATAGNTDVLVHHGSTDAPTVDVVEVGVGAGIIVDNAAYPGFAGYLELPTNDYTLAVQDEENTVTVATYEAPLATLGLTDAAITVVASGFLDPSNNGDGPAFGLYAALATGGPLVALPAPEPAVARVQIIHNSPDDAATSVDVYLNGAILVPGFDFRTATPFIDAPSGVEIQVDIAPAGSADVSESIANFPLTLAEGETYVVVADGITGLSTTVYDPAPAFGLEIYAMGREAAATAGNTDVLVHHGSTDAPTVDVVEVGVGAGNIVDNAAYPGFAGYLELATGDYALAIQDENNTVTVATYAAPLATLGLADAAITVVASGFLDPTMNGDGPGFGLYAALATGGPLVALPIAVANDNPCDAITLPTDGSVTTFDNSFATVAAGEDVITPPAGTDGANSCVSQDGWCGGDLGIQNSIWYSFVATSAGVNITTCTDGNGVDTQVALYSATDCADFSTLSLLGANDDVDGGCTSGTSTFASDLTYCGLTVGDTYWVLVDSYLGEQGEGAISISEVSCPARLQVIHNSPDDVATSVDVYLDGVLLLAGFEFRTATPFIDAPAGVEIQIDIAPAGSADVSESIANFPVTLAEQETYIVVADGITGLSTTTYNPAPAFGLQVYAMGREAASASGNTDVLVHHGSTDAPTVDVVEVGAGAGLIVDDLAYTDFQGYLELPTANYSLEITDETGAVSVVTYGAPLEILGLQNQAITVVASGFFDPSQNGDGPGFGLWVALAEGGELVPLPLFTSVNELEAIDFSMYPNPANDVLNIQSAERIESIAIYDTQGRLVLSEANNIQRVDISSLSEGVYTVAVSIGERISTERLMKL